MPVVPEPQRSLGYALVSWYEHYLVHGPGDVQGEPVELDRELTEFVVCAYALDPETGRRCYDEALLSRVKGRAKSELAGMVTCGEAFAPVRFDHWAEPGEVSPWGYAYEPGEPVGRPVTYPFIRCLATEEGQSGNTYLNTTYMLAEARERHPDVFGDVDIGRDWQTSTRVLLPGGGEIRPSTASSAAKDGGKESFAVADETHLYTQPELRSMYKVVKFNCGKRKQAEPWILQTSTMYAPGEQSVAEATHKAAAKGKGPRLLFDHKGARRHLELADTPELRAEVRYVYGPFAEAMDLDRIVGLLLDETVEEADRRRYWLNEEHAATGKAIDPRHWAARTDPDRVVPDGTPIVAGFDGSLTRDSTVLRGCTRDGHLFTLGFWEAPLDTQGRPAKDWEVPQADVDATIDQVYRRFQVVRGYFDPAWWGSWVPTWAGRYGDERVTAIWTNQESRMARWVRAIVHAIVRGELSHDGDPRAARHWGNAHKRPTTAKDEDGQQLWVLSKDQPNSPRKIDCSMADTLAWAAHNDALTNGEFDQGPLVLEGSLMA